MDRSAIDDQNNDNIVDETQDILEEDVGDDDDNNNEVAMILWGVYIIFKFSYRWNTTVLPFLKAGAGFQMDLESFTTSLDILL